ncbi:MAG: molecular chaperone HtpG [Gammaproteobacteria bacterium RBG_16_51_14]|nr:MAG: molecular chaperone HtpG [Gammaproteobacteria bacterium RBG_16_51_14]
MSIEARQETLGFQAEIRQLLDLMIHSLYSNKEIFLRELISNASDAADKLRFEALKDDSLYENDTDLAIRVEFDEKQKTITVMDNGIGMSREEVIDNLGTIAKSGTRQFFNALTGDQNKDVHLIGQFGVGFYSSFIVARKVEVTTRRAGLSRGEGVRWISTGESDYTIETVDRPKRGTRVVLCLRDGMDEFLNSYRLRGIIRKYSDHISLPILMIREGKDEKGDETVNSATALWARNKKDISEEEYHEFYKHVAHDFEDPLTYLHSKVEGKLEYTSLLFIPSHAQFDLWDREQRHGIKLYVRRVFIMDDAEQLIPAWLRFVRGVVDSDDLPLNISREILQNNRTIDSIRAGCTKKVLGLLQDMADRDAEKYAGFWNEFGRVLKEGVIEAKDDKEEIARLFRFASTHDDSDKQAVSLMNYMERMQQGQKAIYYLTAENFVTARNSPHLEVFRKKGIEVLLLTDPIDEWVTAHLHEFDGKPLQSVTRGELDLGDLEDQDQEDQAENTNQGQDGLTERIRQSLGDKVKEVRTTNRLTTSPACLVSDEHDMGRHLEKILKATGQSIPAVKPILEINPEHPIVMRLKDETDDGRFAEWARILFDQALLSEGGQLEDPAGFVHRLNALFLDLAGSKNTQDGT